MFLWALISDISGSNVRTSSGRSLSRSCGLHAWRTWKVSSVPGANGAALPRSGNLSQFDFLASCNCPAFNGIQRLGPFLCASLVSLTEQVSPLSCNELVSADAMLPNLPSRRHDQASPRHKLGWTNAVLIVPTTATLATIDFPLQLPTERNVEN